MWPFTARPRAEQLYRIPRWLRPATMGLQRFVEFVAEVAPLLFGHQAGALLRRRRSGSLAHGAIPVVRPLADTFVADSIEVCRATSAMQAERATTKGDAERLLGAEAMRLGKLLQHLVQGASERWSDQTVLRR